MAKEQKGGGMKPDKLKEFINFMNENNLSELEIEENGKKIRLKKNYSTIKPENIDYTLPPPPQEKKQIEEKKESLPTIKSPMVGTFYTTPSPEAKPYVTVGKIVNSGDVVCIIEAMKLMNEIKSEISGKIIKISVKNGEPIEFGQTLFVVEPT